jgi:hypothetical protein
MIAFAVVPDGKEPLLLCLLALLIAFVLTRLYTRLARARRWGSANVSGGVHLHHMAVGILLVLGTGLVTIAFWPESPWRELIAIIFGVGAALTLDEFALWLYLADVYWSPEGRRSIDAMLVGLLLGALLLLGASPFGLAEADTVPRAVALAFISVNIAFAAISFLKGKLALGILSVLFPWFGAVGAVRLAKPTSLWARWFYVRRPGNLARARDRYAQSARTTRLWNRFEDIVGGAPHLPSVVVVPLRAIDGALREAERQATERADAA